MIMKIILYLVFIIFFISALLVYINTHPPRYPLHIPPSKYDLKYEDVTFRSTDGLILRGWFIHGEQVSGSEIKRLPTIIICHGLGANKSDFTDLANRLIEAHYNVLLFDFRRHGESDGKRTSIGYLEQKDLKGAIEYLKGRGDVDPDRLGAYGFSLGAAVIILTAVEQRDIKVIVADSPFTSLEEQAAIVIKSIYFLPTIPFLQISIWIYELYFWVDIGTISPIDVIHKLQPTPIMLIGGEEDEQMISSDIQRLFNAASEPKEIWIISGAIHGGTLIKAGDEYTTVVIGYFDRYLQN